MPKKSDDYDLGKSRARDLQATLRSEQARALKKQAEMEALRRELKTVEAQDKPLRSKKTKSVLGLAGSFAGVATGLKTLGGTPRNPTRSPNFSRSTTTNPLANPFNPNYNPSGTLSSQISKNKMKRKAFQKAQSLARHNEEENKIKLKQIKDREARKQRELEKSETKMSWTEPDGSKTILKFDDEGNLIGKEVVEESQERLKARKEQQEVDEAFGKRAEELDDRTILNKKGQPLTKKEYKDSWATDPRTQKSLIRQVGIRTKKDLVNMDKAVRDKLGMSEEDVQHWIATGQVS